MIYITKQEGLYQNKVNSSLVFTGNCKMDYWLATVGVINTVTGWKYSVKDEY